MGLHDGVGQEHHAHEDGREAQQLQMVGGGNGRLPPGGVEQQEDWPRQHRQAHPGRDGQHGDQPEAGGYHPVHLPVVHAGHRHAHRRDQAHRHSGQERGGQVEEGAGEGVLAVEHRRLPLRQPQHVLELAQDDGLIQQVQKAHARLADGDRDTQAQQPPHDDPVALGPVGAPENGAPVFSVVENHVDHGQHSPGADAHNGPRRADLQVLPGADEVPGQGQSDHQLEERLDKLAHRRGHHVLPPLGKAPVGAHDGHAHHRHPQGLDGPVGHGVVHQRGQLPGEQEHGGGPHDAQDHEQGHGGVEAAAHLRPAAGGVGLADELAQGQGQSGGGQGEQKGVDVVGAHEVGDALVPQDVVEGDFIERAADFDKHRGDRHHRDAPHEGLLLFSGHG